MPNQLETYIQQNLAEFMQELREWIELESFSNDVTAVSWMINLVGERLRSLGGEVRLLNGKPHADHVLATWPGVGEPLIIIGHVDTVYPSGTIDTFPFWIDGDVAHGPGVSDMKGCVLLACAALQALQACDRWPSRPLRFLVTSDEELGSITSRTHIENLARPCRAALIIESAGDGGFLKVWRKGVSIYTLTAYGRASHAGVAPEAGVSANHELAHQILEIMRLQQPAIGTTINIGLINGGTASNVVPAEASCTIDVRARTLIESERVDTALRSLRPHLADVRLELEGGINRPPMEQNPATMDLYATAEAIAQELGITVTANGTGGGSDGNFTSAIGVPTLDGLGGVGGGSHSLDEWFSVREFAARAALLARLLEVL